MRVAVSALIALSVFLVVGCDNDKNTVDPIPKYHKVYPVFHVKIDNGYQKFGVDSAQLTVTPSVGWPGPVYTDVNGFLGTLASGTFIDRIDTTIVDDSMVVETSYVVFGFEPSQAYTFSFNRGEPFTWLDSFRADYVYTVDSLWLLLSAETLRVSVVPDTNVAPVTVLDSVAVITDPLDTLVKPPSWTEIQELVYGYWFNTRYVIPDPDATQEYPPDSTSYDTLLWGFWNRIDSFFLPADSSFWCDLDSIIIVEETLEDNLGFISIVIDSVFVYSNCDVHIDSTRNKIYRHYGWGTYPGGDPGEGAIPSFDTTVHFYFPDTAKGLLFEPDGLSIYLVPDTGQPITDYREATIELRHKGASSNLDSMSVRLTMPPVEVFPDYEIFIREAPPTKK